MEFQIDSPHCSNAAYNKENNKHLRGCVFHTVTPVTCSGLHLSPFSLLTEPMFIGCVSLTLILSLALLMWTVVQCSKKRPESPVQQPLKKPPRSLTEMIWSTFRDCPAKR